MVNVYFNDNYLEFGGRVFGGGASFLVLFSDGREVRYSYNLYSVRQVSRLSARVSLVIVRLFLSVCLARAVCPSSVCFARSVF